MTKIKGSRMTRQRKVILEELRKVRSHPTAIEIYELVRKKVPRISLGTVYRNLEFLWKAGEILKLRVAGDCARYDGYTESHHHVRCVSCGRMDDVGGVPKLSIEEFRNISRIYEVQGYKLEFFGICPLCREKKVLD